MHLVPELRHQALGQAAPCQGEYPGEPHVIRTGMTGVRQGHHRGTTGARQISNDSADQLFNMHKHMRLFVPQP